MKQTLLSYPTGLNLHMHFTPVATWTDSISANRDSDVGTQQMTDHVPEEARLWWRHTASIQKTNAVYIQDINGAYCIAETQ